MLNKTEICNIALGIIGANTISSTDDPSKESKGCNIYYKNAKMKLLASYPWSFAACTVELTPSVEKGFFQLPSDFISLQSLAPIGVGYEIIGDKLSTPAKQPILRYTRMVEDIEVFSPLFYDCLAYTLASELAVYITGSHSQALSLAKIAEGKLSEAVKIDSNTTGRRSVECVSPLTNARRG